MKVLNYLLILVVVMVCTGCFDPTFAWRVDRDFRERGPFIISPNADDYVSRTGQQGFAITIQPEFAKRIGAPNSKEFHRVLEEKLLSEEKIRGRKFCEFGYKLWPMYYYHGMYAEINADCLKKD